MLDVCGGGSVVLDMYIILVATCSCKVVHAIDGHLSKWNTMYSLINTHTHTHAHGKVLYYTHTPNHIHITIIIITQTVIR